MTRRPLSLFASVLFLISGLCHPSQAGTSLSPTVDSKSGITIDVESWLSTSPKQGMVPITVTVRNDSGTTGLWQINTSCSGSGSSATYTTSLAVEAGRQGKLTIYAPVGYQGQSYYSNLRCQVSGPGVTHGGYSNLSGKSNTSNTSFIAMSTALANKNGLRDLGNWLSSSSSSSDLNGSEVDMTSAPDDWRGYTGIDQLWIDEAEWTALPSAVKAALQEWLVAGGQLFIMATDASVSRLETLQLPTPPATQPDATYRKIGAGSLRVLKYDGAKLTKDPVADLAREADVDAVSNRFKTYPGDWSLAKTLGTLKINAPLIFGFITVFGILIGPVNLFWLAGPGRRHRLFWTTPLLSLAGSLCLLGLMIFQDGIGGHGARITLLMLQPDQKKVGLVQEQASKTGVLLGSSFAATETALITPLDLTGNYSDSGYYSYRNNNNSENFWETAQERGGAWFSSRAVQGQLIRTVRPSRIGLEWHAPGEGRTTPEVLSTAEVTLSTVFVVDEDGHFWSAQDVRTGVRTPLVASTQQLYSTWFKDTYRANAGPVIQETLNNLRDRKGYAFAMGDDAEKLAVPTLGAIRWNQDHLLIAGPYVKP